MVQEDPIEIMMLATVRRFHIIESVYTCTPMACTHNSYLVDGLTRARDDTWYTYYIYKYIILCVTHIENKIMKL